MRIRRGYEQRKRCRVKTHDEYFVVCNQADAGGTAGDLVLVLGIYSGPYRQQSRGPTWKRLPLPFSIARSVAKKPSFRACS